MKKAMERATHRNAAPGWILYLVLFNTAHHFLEVDLHEWVAFLGRLPGVLQDLVVVIDSVTKLIAAIAAAAASIAVMRRRRYNERAGDA